MTLRIVLYQKHVRSPLAGQTRRAKGDRAAEAAGREDVFRPIDRQCVSLAVAVLAGGLHPEDLASRIVLCEEERVGGSAAEADLVERRWTREAAGQVRIPLVIRRNAARFIIARTACLSDPEQSSGGII